jgi:hypothetical protein
MIVRRYCGSSIEKVQAAMRQDLGPQAIVVASTTRQERRWLPGLGRTVHEVTAVAEDALGAERPLPLAASRTTADADDVVSNTGACAARSGFWTRSCSTWTCACRP